MNWKDTLKKLGHENDGCYISLMSWFDEHLGESLPTCRMDKLGFRYWKKSRREWAYYNGATIERKARDLRTFNLLESYTEGPYVYFHAKQGVAGQIEPPRWVVQVPKRQMLIDGEWKWVERPDLIEV